MEEVAAEKIVVEDSVAMERTEKAPVENKKGVMSTQHSVLAFLLIFCFTLLYSRERKEAEKNNKEEVMAVFADKEARREEVKDSQGTDARRNDHGQGTANK